MKEWRSGKARKRESERLRAQNERAKERENERARERARESGKESERAILTDRVKRIQLVATGKLARKKYLEKLHTECAFVCMCVCARVCSIALLFCTRS